MSSNCSEFNFLIDRKSIYTSNDIPSLVAYNKCLINEINNLTTKTDELEGSLKSNSSDIKSLNDSISNQEKLFETKIVMLSSSFDSKIENVATVQEQSVDNFTSMFETIQNSYANHLTGLSIILACAGIFFFLGAKAYKKREINDLKLKLKVEQKKLDILNRKGTDFGIQKKNLKLQRAQVEKKYQSLYCSYPIPQSRYLRTV